MNKMKSDRDKCQFLDSHPKTQLHMDALGGETGLQQTAHVIKVEGFKLLEMWDLSQREVAAKTSQSKLGWHDKRPKAQKEGGHGISCEGYLQPCVTVTQLIFTEILA